MLKMVNDLWMLLHQAFALQCSGISSQMVHVKAAGFLTKHRER